MHKLNIHSYILASLSSIVWMLVKCYLVITTRDIYGGYITNIVLLFSANPANLNKYILRDVILNMQNNKLNNVHLYTKDDGKISLSTYTITSPASQNFISSTNRSFHATKNMNDTIFLKVLTFLLFWKLKFPKISR